MSNYSWSIADTEATIISSWCHGSNICSVMKLVLLTKTWGKRLPVPIYETYLCLISLGEIDWIGYTANVYELIYRQTNTFVWFRKV